jgi:hypothetical protein
MEEIPNSGTSIRRQEPSRTSNRRDGHGTSKATADQARCKHGTPTLNGNNSSSGMHLMELSRTISKPTEDLMSLEEEIKKAITLEFTKEMELLPRSGRLSMKTKPMSSSKKVQASTDSRSTDHSTSSQE